MLNNRSLGSVCTFLFYNIFDTLDCSVLENGCFQWKSKYPPFVS